MIRNAKTIEQSVRERYAASAEKVEAELCCAVGDYDRKLLDAIPKAILDVDYGCGNPSKWVQPGDTVLDLGSGSGKMCFIAAQVAGSEGRVIGVDFNPPMLALARGATGGFAKNVGFANVAFKCGRIQDLALDLEALGAHLEGNPATDYEGYLRAGDEADRIRREDPMIADDSIDLIISNCVLNLVRADQKEQLFAEMYRVLKRKGRCVISDIVCDEPVPAHLQADEDLWSGCISGAFEEGAFLEAFERAGFHGIEIVERSEAPWRVVEGIEFRSMTVRAYKGKEGHRLEGNQAVIYRGPWQAVLDDDGHTLYRGERMAVCAKTFELYTSAPYADSIVPVPPHEEVPLDDAAEFTCGDDARRSARVTKGSDYSETKDAADDCCAGGGCC
ncbi:MAG: methyltransferase domain-containing protein [Planctomycetes bacterium]|nr:methyltransferase domain-containing protein [Planctomycetota bacterium]